MKKTISIVLILVICLSLSSCYLFDDTYKEIWSCIDEFDVDEFDATSLISHFQSDPDVLVESSDLMGYRTELIESSYIMIYSNESAVLVYICYDTNSAKELYDSHLTSVSRVFTPYESLVRINNAVFCPLYIGQSNLMMPKIMSEIGIEKSCTLKVCTKRRSILSFTNKSLDEIVSKIESRGYSIVRHNYDEDTQVNDYSFVSEDGTDMYEIVACHHKNSIKYVLACLSYIYEMETDDTVTQIYYSFNDGYSMIFFGNSIETRDFWNEIR